MAGIALGQRSRSYRVQMTGSPRAFVGVSALLSLLLGACSSDSLESNGSEGPPSMQPSQPGPDPVEAAGAILPAEPALTRIFDTNAPLSATGLAFNPVVPGELWVTLRQFPTDVPCTQTVRSGCAALVGEVAIISGADSDSPTSRIERDDNAWHFMRRPTSIAFGTNGNLATCGEARTGNFEDDPIDFHGPVLWSSDPNIFGVPATAEQNGTHLDMLHSTPFCMGIAHERDNVYWAFNGQIGALDRYDFNDPHVIGGEDHTDGELWRYLDGELSRVPEVPSHLAVDTKQRAVYAADTGNQRVVRLNMDSGSPAGEVLEYDGMPLHVRMADAAFVTFVAQGVLEAPSGIALHAGLVLATDNASGTVHAFDAQGAPVASADLGLGPGELGGITVGPDGKLYVANLRTAEVFRVD